MNNMNNKNNDEKTMRKFNTFYFVYRIFHVNNTNGLDISSEDIVQEIFLNSDECYEYLITQIPDLKDVLRDYTNKTYFISKINYLRAKLPEINNYFPDNIIFSYIEIEEQSLYCYMKSYQCDNILQYIAHCKDKPGTYQLSKLHRCYYSNYYL